MKRFLSCVFLCSAIVLINFGIHTSNLILICIGGAFAGAYNAIITRLKEE